MNILLFDIETSPNFGAYFQLYREGNIVWTTSHWYMLSFAYKWLGEKTSKCFALPDFKTYQKDKENDKELVLELWKLLDKADIVIAHNGVAFDTKKTNSRFIYHRIPPPSPYQEIDTKLVAKRYFKFDSNKLDDLGDYLKIGRKIQTGGFVLWKSCLDGDLKAWNTMKKYNKQDVQLLESVYLAMRPYMKTHPNRALMGGLKVACPKCKSLRIQKRGYIYTRVSVLQRYHCDDCGGWSSATISDKKITQVR